MHNTRWLLGLFLAVTSTLAACSTETSLGREGEDASRRGEDVQPGPRCVMEPTQVYVGCNEDRSLPLSAGLCESDGTCWCQSGFVLNPTTNRCRLVAEDDAAVAMCTVGVDQTCSDQKDLVGAGTCAGKGCFCNAGFVINPATGRCRLAPATDAGAKTDSVAGKVCTFMLDQTCNDDDTFSGTAGVCEKGFTCSCNSGFVINPATGRCRAGAKADAATATPDAGVSKDTLVTVVDAPVGKDLGKDTPGVCTFGMDQTCNDSPSASWVAGTCQSNGTCVCGSGYVLNPSSGRCAYVPRDAGPDIKPVCTVGSDETCNDSPASATWGICLATHTCSCTGNSAINASTGKCMRPEISTCAGTYTACGCGCCGGVTPTALCYYPSAGDSLTAIRSADEAVKNNTNCEMAGCSLGQRYLCCTEAAVEPAGSATYSASYYVGGYDRVILTKTGNDGNCVALQLVYASSGSDGHPLRVTTPFNWSVEGALRAGACGRTLEESIGAQGTVTFTPSGTSCLMSAHLTAFYFADASGILTSKRIDADDVPITGGAPSGFCK